MDLEDKLRHERNRALKEGIEYGREQGLKKGNEQGQITIAQRMFKQGMPFDAVRSLVDSTISDAELHVVEDNVFNDK